jgi:hypothetical protein
MLREAINRIVFTSDIFRIDDTRKNILQNPQAMNIDWMYELFAPILMKLTGAEASKLVLDAPNDPHGRFALFSETGIEFSTRGWAQIYDADISDILDKIPALNDERTLFVTYEAPPYLYNYLKERRKACIDFTIHPIRFLDDYVFGVRSTLEEINSLARLHMVPKEIIDVKVRQIRARARRLVHRDKVDPEFGCTVFIGQMPIDASLIHGGRIVSEEEIQRVMNLLCDEGGGPVYYKRHPHAKDAGLIDRILQSTSKRATLLDINIYVLLGCGRVSRIVSMSSSVLYEAQCFDIATLKCLASPDIAFIPGRESKPDQYIPVQPYFLQQQFWENAMAGKPITEFEKLTLGDGFIKEAINMRWGA